MNPLQHPEFIGSSRSCNASRQPIIPDPAIPHAEALRPQRKTLFGILGDRLKLLIALISLALFVPQTELRADGIIAVLKSPNQVIRNDANTGVFKGSISVNNAIAVGCDGETIAVLLSNGTVNRYNASTGAFNGSISVGQKATSVQVSGGVIAVTIDRQVKRYKAGTGVFMGSTSI